MTSLTDEQYDGLKEFANRHGMSLNGYQSVDNGILLNNNLDIGVWGKSIKELQTAIVLTARRYKLDK